MLGKLEKRKVPEFQFLKFKNGRSSGCAGEGLLLHLSHSRLPPPPPRAVDMAAVRHRTKKASRSIFSMNFAFPFTAQYEPNLFA